MSPKIYKKMFEIKNYYLVLDSFFCYSLFIKHNEEEKIMKNTNMVTIKDIKNQIGLYYYIPVGETYDMPSNDIRKVIRRFHMVSFKQQVEMVFNMFFSEEKTMFLNIEEKFYSQYGTWFSDDSSHIFTTKESACNSILEEIQCFYDSVVNTAKKTIIGKSLSSSNMVKKVIANTKFGGQLNTIIENKDLVKNKSLEELIKVNIVKSYDNENQLVQIPEKWDDYIKANKIPFYILKDDKLTEVNGYLFKVELNSNEEVSLIFEIANNEVYPFVHYSLSENEYKLSDERVFFNNEAAKNEIRNQIALHEKKIEEMKELLS